MKKFIFFSACLALILSSCDQNDEKDSENINLINNYDEEMHVCTFDLHNENSNKTAKPNAAIINSPGWVVGQTIKVKFLNGTPDFQERVMEVAQEWTNYANIKFEFVPITEFADIRISFRWNNDAGSWSILGKNFTHSTNHQNEPSMNFGWSSIASYSITKKEVLHEFGHALGLVHEQSSPASSIAWNVPKAYKYYSDLMGWSEEQVDKNILYKYNTTQTNYNKYDPLSIMHYYIPGSITLDGNTVNEVFNLSELDKRFMEKKYPFPIKSILYPGERLNSDSSTTLTSPDGNYRLFIKGEGITRSLSLYDYIDFKEVMNIEPNIKFSNMTSGNVYLEIRGNTLLLFKGSVSKRIGPDSPFPNIDYITLTNSGKVEVYGSGFQLYSFGV